MFPKRWTPEGGIASDLLRGAFVVCVINDFKGHVDKYF
jgi:hypothetical protein